MIGCLRTGPRHPIEGWCPQCSRVTMYRRIKAYERRRGYVYPGGHIQSPFGPQRNARWLAYHQERIPELRGYVKSAQDRVRRATMMRPVP